MSERPHVAVVGGGLAGIAAALACADAGVRVSLLESRKWLGGATSSFRRDGMTLDTGQHVFLRCCVAYRGLLERLGTADRTRLQRRLEVPVLSPGRPATRLRRSGLPAPLHLLGTLAAYPLMTPAERLRAARASLALRRVDPADPAADARTFGAWLGEHGQSANAVRALWDLFGLPSLNLPAAEASLALAARVFRTGLLEDATAADVGVPSVSLAALHGEPAARELAARGAEVDLGRRVRRVEAGAAGGALAVEADGGRVDADAVIVAVPHERVGPLLPEGAIPDPATVRALGSSPIVNVHVVYDRAVTGLAFAATVGSPVQWVFDRTAAAGLGRGQYLALSLSGAAGQVDRTVEDLRGEFLPALTALFPRAASARVERFLVTRERHATFRQAPGTAALRPGPDTGVPGLFLAGAWTDTGWPATMEGAVRSGVTAARRALLSVGRARNLPAEVGR